MSPFLSIITINYNNAAGLQQTIDSVLSQTYTDFEYIIIDGGSTDGSAEIITHHKKQFSYWISEPDDGIFNAMNKGIDKARGTYLQFLNSGDVFTSPSALQDFVNHPHFTGDIIYGDYKFEDGEKVYPDQLYPAYFMKTSLPHQSTLFKKTVFDRMGGYDERYKIASDRAFYIQCFLSAQFTFTHIPYFLVLFDLAGVSNDASFLIAKEKEDELIFRSLYGKEYDKHQKVLALEEQQKQRKKNSFFGIANRILRKIKSYVKPTR
ncbi:glycosyltransferase family 2 protein [Jejudonia soesokkakensis]|uniref:Glycosyltransferase family 2 protein n=1 Tax=Jejudonia soesokkakensis TaxID=1323432 RepID=A0ABW2MPQ4_9FLAO